MGRLLHNSNGEYCASCSCAPCGCLLVAVDWPEHKGLVVCTIDKISKTPPVSNLIDEALDHVCKHLLDVPNIMDEIESLIGGEASQPALMTPSVAEKLSAVAAFGEISQQLAQH